MPLPSVTAQLELLMSVIFHRFRSLAGARRIRRGRFGVSGALERMVRKSWEAVQALVETEFARASAKRQPRDERSEDTFFDPIRIRASGGWRDARPGISSILDTGDLTVSGLRWDSATIG